MHRLQQQLVITLLLHYTWDMIFHPLELGTRHKHMPISYWYLTMQYRISSRSAMIERLPRTWMMFPAKKITINNITNCLFVTCKNYNVIIDLFPIDFNVFLFQHFIYIQKDWSVAETHKKWLFTDCSPHHACTVCCGKTEKVMYILLMRRKRSIDLYITQFSNYYQLYNTIS